MPHFAPRKEESMRLPEDEPFYTRQNLRSAIAQRLKQLPVEKLAPAARAALVQHIAAQAPAEAYLAGGQISIEALTSLISEVIAELTQEGG